MNMPVRPPRQKHCHQIELGIWVTTQAALNRLGFDDIAAVYRKGGGRWPSSSKVQVSKLRVFWHFGDKFGAEGMLYLWGWKPYQKPGISTYETLIQELREFNDKGRLP
jgi:hypothetical protein